MMGSPSETHLSAAVARLTFHSSEADSVGVSVFSSVVPPALPKPFQLAVQSGREANGLTIRPSKGFSVSAA